MFGRRGGELRGKVKSEKRVRFKSFHILLSFFSVLKFASSVVGRPNATY